jgi:RNA-binding motif protein, X-linked 2
VIHSEQERFPVRRRVGLEMHCARLKEICQNHTRHTLLVVADHLYHHLYHHHHHYHHPMNTILEIQKINERELELGLAGTAASWHVTYGTSAWIYVGNVSFDLTEGDLICVLSQYGEVDDFWLVRNDETGISRGYGYAKYEDARSCVLAVDNLIGIPVRT